MHTIHRFMARAARGILRLAPFLVLLSLAYVCRYIQCAAPDGGVMTGFRLQVAEMLGCVIASLGLLIAGAAIPDVRIF